MSAHVVVTGAGGFVGGFVARALAARGFDVTGISRRPVLPRADDSLRLAWREADLRSSGCLPERFDVLLHCAAETPERCPERERLYERNLEATRSAFDQACAAGAGAAVFLSSMSAYGAISVPVLTEDTPTGELDTYGHAKRDSEALLEACVAKGLPSGLAIRLPGTVGKGSHDNFLSVALGRVLSGEAIKGRNPDAPFNNVVHVGDLAAFLCDWASAPKPGYAVTNLAAVEPLPVREVLALLFSTSGRLEQLSFEPGGTKLFQISLDRALSLGYRPSTVRASVEAFVRDCL